MSDGRCTAAASLTCCGRGYSSLRRHDQHGNCARALVPCRSTRWRPEEKLRILAELDEHGVRFDDVARRRDFSRSLLRQWRDALRRGRLASGVAAFVPLRVVPELRDQLLLPHWRPARVLTASRTSASRSCWPTIPRCG
ncbi:transposase [Falsiroseomonas sp. HC035]|uniref:transposase n=1 Tax=Falsiroseomonas sp. HC035 TaxID=3390999 RepID=UPI003D3131D2